MVLVNHETTNWYRFLHYKLERNSLCNPRPRLWKLPKPKYCQQTGTYRGQVHTNLLIELSEKKKKFWRLDYFILVEFFIYAMSKPFFCVVEWRPDFSQIFSFLRHVFSPENRFSSIKTSWCYRSSWFMRYSLL